MTAVEFVPCLPGVAHRVTPQGRAQAAVEAVKARPGEWAIYRRTPKTPQLGAYRANFPGTEWAYRKTGEDEYTTFLRWVAA